MATWKRNKLGDLIETQKGFAFKSGWYTDTGRPIVKVSNFTDDSVDSSSLVCIPGEIASAYMKYELKKDDVVVQTVGSWPTNPASVVGKCVRIRSNALGALLNQNAVKITPTKDLDVIFLFYLLRSENFKTYIIGTAQGAANQAAITLEAIRAFEFATPSLPVQRQIASILTTYDDLIENNTRRIAVLEEMAQRLYKEWFVYFRFPGHEQVRMVESELGLIPEGWACMGLLSLATVKYGKNLPKSRLIADGKYPVYGAAKVIGRYNEFTRDKRTIIAGCRGSVGEFQITAPYCFVTNNSFTFDPDLGSDFFWLFYALKDRGLTDVVGGSAQPQITLEGLTNVNLITPSKDSRERFGEVVRPVFNLKWTLEAKNTNLRAQRDLLLPKLISGEIDVSIFPEPEAVAA